MENEFSDEEEEGSEEYEVGECPSAFTLLENEYKNILAKMQENEELEFCDAYTKLFEAFFQTHTSENDLILKTAELEDKIATHLEEIAILSNSVISNLDTITDMTEKLNNACHLADLANAREQKGQEIIESMRSQILKLNTELELKSQMGSDDDDGGALNKTKEGFEREKQRLIDEIFSLKRKLTNALSYSEELEHKNSQADLKTNELNNLLEQQTGETSKKQRAIEKLNEEIATLNGDIENLNNLQQQALETINGNNKLIRQLEIQLKDQKIATEKAKKNGEITQVKLEKAQLEYDTINLEYVTLKEKHAEITKLFKLKTDECTHMKSDLTKVSKARDAYEKKYTILEHLKSSIEQDRDKIRNSLHLLEREMIVTKKQSEVDQKQIESLLKEKEVLHKNIMRIQNTVDRHVKLIKIQEQIKHKLEAAINNYISDISYQKKMLGKLEKERNKAIEESLDLTQQVEDSMNEIKLKQQNIYDLKKIIAESETKLRQLQNLFEAVRADRNAFQKQLQDATSEVNELKSKYKVSIHQNGQLKEDISVKETLLLKDENMLKKLNKDKENLKIEVQTGLYNIKSLKNDIDELKQNENTLLKFIQEHDATIRKQGKELEQIMNDRDVIGAQLVRRNDEIGLLYQKIKILEITLNRGEAQYDQRIEDIRLLKLEIKRLRQEKDFLSKSISNMIDLKHEVFTLERELAQERLKCRALEDELQQPMNIHRWRKLEGSDPELLELLQKIQILQKRLLNQTTEAIDREKQLKETEKLYFNLRQMLARQPGPDVQNELIKTQKALALRGTKMKCLVSELNMHETQSIEYKMDLEKVTNELAAVKKKYYKQKKLNERHLGTDTKLPAIENKTDQTQFTGGGFKMA